MNQELLDRVLESPRLPSLPTIALETIELVQQKDVNIKQIANTIQHDPALSSKILKTVNSSFYGQAHSISTISHALVVLGLNSVKTLALGFSLVANLRDQGGDNFDHVAFWRRSLYAATAARTLAKHVGLVQQEEAFLGGLLQDLGMLAMNQTLAEEYTPVLHETGGEHRRLRELEQEMLALDHCVVGKALAEAWHLPPLLVQPIAYHETPEQATEDTRDMVRCVALGNHAADLFMESEPGGALERFHRLAEKWFEIPDAAADPLLKNIHQQTNEMRRLFDLPTGELGNPDEILAKAHEAMLEITLQAQQHTTELEQRNKQLVEEASTDTLTGVANRRKFNDYIRAQFDKVQTGAGLLSVLFLDVDHFKKFNDSYGHPTGDRVLVEVAATLVSLVEEPGLVARYGGEEFSVILPRMDRRSAAKLAEKIRVGIETTTVMSDENQPLHVTASIGVATYDGNSFSQVDQLVKAADQGVYAAKSSGRNCVRIFAPRRRSNAA